MKECFLRGNFLLRNKYFIQSQIIQSTVISSELNMISHRIIELSPKYKISEEVLEKIKPYANSNMLSSQQRLGLLRLFKVVLI